MLPSRVVHVEQRAEVAVGTSFLRRSWLAATHPHIMRMLNAMTKKKQAMEPIDMLSSAGPAMSVVLALSAVNRSQVCPAFRLHAAY